MQEQYINPRFPLQIIDEDCDLSHYHRLGDIAVTAQNMCTGVVSSSASRGSVCSDIGQWSLSQGLSSHRKRNGNPPPFILFHASALLGYLGSTLLVPETKSAIVILGNTLGLQDAPNWVSGLLLETLLDTPEKNDYVKLTREAAHAGSKLFPTCFNRLKRREY